MGLFKNYVSQTRKPEGTLGKMMLSGMNSGHAKMADWGLAYLTVSSPEEIADLGCGGGRNAGELLKKYPGAKVTAVDYSELSVAKAREYNQAMINAGRCKVMQGDVSALIFDDASFDLVTAFETIYFWNIEKSFAQVHRVLKDGGYFMICNESDGTDEASKKFESIIDGMRCYTPEQISAALRAAGFSSVKTEHHPSKPWITVIARKSCNEDDSEDVPGAQASDKGIRIAGSNMTANYKNWVPKGMIAGMTASTAVLAAGTAAAVICGKKLNPTVKKLVAGTLGAGTLASGIATAWSVNAYRQFSYNGDRQLSKQIVEGTAEYITLPEGGVGLDVGCGSGALTIACAKRNPQGRMVGVDRWGKEYASFNQELCENNSAAEGVNNTEYHQGDACRLDFPDETFDAVTSNYVYHNITGVNKQQLLRETLRVLKKGGTFAIHDIMSKSRYGDMQKFVNELYEAGYEKVQLIDTTSGKFMNRCEAGILGLCGSALLVGRK